MGPYLKSIFRKSLNSEPTLVFLFSFIEIGRNKGQQFFLSKPKAFDFAISKPCNINLWRGQ